MQQKLISLIIIYTETFPMRTCNRVETNSYNLKGLEFHSGTPEIADDDDFE